MIVLTKRTGGANVIVNPQNITKVSTYADAYPGTRITFVNGDEITVEECLEIVAGKLGAA